MSQSDQFEHDEFDTAAINDPLPQIELLEPDKDTPVVAILMGSKNDMPVMEMAAQELKARRIKYEVEIMSSHHNPDEIITFSKEARTRGIKVIIAGAALAAVMPGVVAAHSDLPVIGVPLTSATSIGGGLDALLAMAQMPPGVPMAVVGVDAAKNAAILAAQILSI